MRNATNHYAASTATPHEIADAAQSKCSAHIQKFENLYVTYMTSVTAPTVRQQVLRDVRNSTQEMKIKTRGMVVQWVLDSRLRTK
jgi:hypothetical protein